MANHNSELAVRIHELSKTYRTVKRGEGVGSAIKSLFNPQYEEVKAVDSIFFQIKQGSFVGFLGPNGAGKTTTIKMLTGILFPTSGEISVLGHTPFERKPELLRQIALVMGNKQQLWWDLPASESFKVLKEIYELDSADYNKRLNQLVEALNVGDKLQVQIRKLSLGERMKCEIIAALLHSPTVVFLDEPTIGLDITSQKAIRSFLAEYNKETGATILLTSHYMQDIQALCERVIVINHGKIAYDGDLAELSRQFGESKLLKVTLDSPVAVETLQSLGQVHSMESLEVNYLVEDEPVAKLTSRILNELPVHDLSVQETPIEAVIEKAFEQKV